MPLKTSHQPITIKFKDRCSPFGQAMLLSSYVSPALLPYYLHPHAFFFSDSKPNIGLL